MAEKVFHGSPEHFEMAHPKRNVRVNKEHKVIFDQESFHATPHRWIALAYAHHSKPFLLDGKEVRYNMAVSLYNNNKIVEIIGTESLEKSLEALYSGGGYLLTFDGNEFFYTEGLGDLEVIADKATKPLHIEHISDPVAQMRAEGVKFVFVDISLPENARWRNYKIKKDT
jgi:hypothetical protein